jgi:hypothetical protein
MGEKNIIIHWLKPSHSLIQYRIIGWMWLFVAFGEYFYEMHKCGLYDFLFLIGYSNSNGNTKNAIIAFNLRIHKKHVLIISNSINFLCKTNLSIDRLFSNVPS